MSEIKKRKINVHIDYKNLELVIFIAIFTILAIALRVSYFNYKSGDYNSFLYKWFNAIKEKGGIKGFEYTADNCDYTSAYVFLITLMTLFPVDSLYSYKIVSCLFDIVMAAYVALIVLHVNKNKVTSVCAYAVILFLPNVFLNSAVWAQCDSIFTCFVIMSLYYILKGKSGTAMAMYGIAFAFKIQAVFFAPVIIVLLFRKKIKITGVFWMFGSYFLCSLPAMIFGVNPLIALFGAYSVQVGEYSSRLSLNAPNLYQLFVKSFTSSYVSKMGVFFALGVCGILCVYFYRYEFEFTDKLIIAVSYLFTVMLPFVLPHMHERYFYLADITAVIFAFVYYKKSYISVLTVYASFRVVMRYLFDNENTKINFVYMAFIMLIGIVLLCQFLINEISNQKKLNSEKKQ